MNNIIGTTIGIYTIIDVCENLTKDRHKLYKGRCIYCGKEFIMKLHDFKKAKSCTHNKIKWNFVCMSSIYNKMINRCYNENDKDYKYYGRKGIKVCDEWLNNPVLFELWALDNGYIKGLTIDRINPNEGYSPENCRWLSLEENSRRAGKVNWITVNNETLTGRQWAEKFGLVNHIFNRYIKKYGLYIIQQLILEISKNPKLLQQRKANQSLISLYNINID